MRRKTTFSGTIRHKLTETARFRRSTCGNSGNTRFSAHFPLDDTENRTTMPIFRRVSVDFPQDDENPSETVGNSTENGHRRRFATMWPFVQNSLQKSVRELVPPNAINTPFPGTNAVAQAGRNLSLQNGRRPLPETALPQQKRVVVPRRRGFCRTWRSDMSTIIACAPRGRLQISDNCQFPSSSDQEHRKRSRVLELSGSFAEKQQRELPFVGVNLSFAGGTSSSPRKPPFGTGNLPLVDGTSLWAKNSPLRRAHLLPTNLTLVAGASSSPRAM